MQEYHDLSVRLDLAIATPSVHRSIDLFSLHIFSPYKLLAVIRGLPHTYAAVTAPDTSPVLTTHFSSALHRDPKTGRMRNRLELLPLSSNSQFSFYLRA